MPIHLSDKKCVACEGGTPPLSESLIATYQKELHADWRVIDGKKITREFRFSDFANAIAFANAVARIAEEEGHHPDLHIFYGKVVIDLTTHAIGGLSENDFILASKIDIIGA